MQIGYLGKLLHEGRCVVYPLSAGLASDPSVEFQMGPQIQWLLLSILCDWSLKRGHKYLSTSKSWELSRGRLHPRNLFFHVPNPNTRVYKVLFIRRVLLFTGCEV